MHVSAFDSIECDRISAVIDAEIVSLTSLVKMLESLSKRLIIFADLIDI